MIARPTNDNASNANRLTERLDLDGAFMSTGSADGRSDFEQGPRPRSDRSSLLLDRLQGREAIEPGPSLLAEGYEELSTLRRVVTDFPEDRQAQVRQVL